jgi:hypothetical protein
MKLNLKLIKDNLTKMLSLNKKTSEMEDYEEKCVKATFATSSLIGTALMFVFAPEFSPESLEQGTFLFYYIGFMIANIIGSAMLSFVSILSIDKFYNNKIIKKLEKYSFCLHGVHKKEKLNEILKEVECLPEEISENSKSYIISKKLSKEEIFFFK